MQGEQCLVRRDDIGSGVQGIQNVRARRLDSTHDLNHDVGAENERMRIRRKQLPRDIGRSGGIHVTNGNADKVKCCPHSSRKFLAVLEKESGDLCSHRAATEQGDT